MSNGGPDDPFTVLGLPAQPGLGDDEIRAAWRRIAAATHPDRPDGGDPALFAEAGAAYTVLRSRFDRGEALADLATPRGGRGPTRRPGNRLRRQRHRAAVPAADHPRLAALRQIWAQRRALPGWLATRRLTARVWQGRPARLATRIAVAVAVSVAVAWVGGALPATPAVIVGVLTWLVLTARHDVARH